MMRPLLAMWRIRASELPDRLLDAERPAPAFTLPGAKALAGFADLIGGDEEETAPSAPDTEDAPFPLPAMIPEDVTGCAELFLDVDFGALPGTRAVLTIDEISGSGDILLGDTVIARFGGVPDVMAQSAAKITAVPCALAADLTDALRRGRKETLTIRFDDSRPAGVPGPVFLHTANGGWLSRLTVAPAAASRTMTVSACIHAGQEGRYALRVTPQPQHPGDPLEPAREIAFTLNPCHRRRSLLRRQAAPPCRAARRAFLYGWKDRRPLRLRADCRRLSRQTCAVLHPAWAGRGMRRQRKPDCRPAGSAYPRGQP